MGTFWVVVGIALVDADIVNPVAQNYSWTSWSRRNRR